MTDEELFSRFSITDAACTFAFYKSGYSSKEYSQALKDWKIYYDEILRRRLKAQNPFLLCRNSSMTEEAILKHFKKKAEELLPCLGNGLSMLEYIDELAELVREAMRKARREALRGN